MYTAKDAEARIAHLKSSGTGKAEIIRQVAELCLGWPYVWASNGQMCTPEWRRNRLPYCPDKKYSDMIRNNCPVLNGSQEPAIVPYSGGKISQVSCSGCKWDGCRCFDCQGFVHWLFECVGVPLYGAGATTQWSTASNWAARGEIASMPPGLVCAVYKRKEDKMSHAGMSMGDGNGGVIHCSTIVKNGNVHTDRPAWTHWGIPKGLYSAEELKAAGIEVLEGANMPTLRRGNQGDEVADLQMLMNSKFGYKLDIDGDFGSKTEAAVKDFQRKQGLNADGVVGKKTWAALGVKDINVLDNNVGNISQPADNGNNESPPTICMAYADFQAMRAAVVTAYGILKKYEGELI